VEPIAAREAKPQRCYPGSVPVGLADAVLAVLARDRPVPAAEAAAIAMLAAPDDAVAEVQLDPPDGALAAVIGFAAPGTRAVIAGTVSGTGREDALAPALTRWLDALEPHARHWGIKLGAPHQLYVRGRFEAPLAASVAAPGRAAELDRGLAAAGASHFAMLGVELAGGAITRHVGYVAVTDPRAAAALAAARGVTGSIAADLALLAPGAAWTHLSWDLATPAGPVKVDVGARPAAEAMAIAARLGLDGAALAARLAALGLGDPSHVGLRLGAPPTRALTLYFRVTAS
jgi:hypothetical protein